jgi:CBS domain containing-hemolysin-like protein
LKEEIPTSGSLIKIDNYEFKIKEVSLTKIERVILRVKDDS